MEEDAARAHDEAAARLGRPMNFYPHNYDERHAKGETKGPRAGAWSKFKGVFWDRFSGKWKAELKVDGKLTAFGVFDDEEDAARAYDVEAAKLGRPLNFSNDQSRAVVAAKFAATNPSSQFKGVTWKKLNKKWEAQIKIDGKKSHVGLYDDEEAAARAYDEVAAKQGRPVNFPVAEGGSRAMKGAYGGSSQYKGVWWNKRESKWRARIRFEGKAIELGHFKEEEEAARAYDKAAERVGRPMNFLDRQPQPPAASSSDGLKRGRDDNDGGNTGAPGGDDAEVHPPPPQRQNRAPTPPLLCEEPVPPPPAIMVVPPAPRTAASV